MEGGCYQGTLQVCNVPKHTSTPLLTLLKITRRLAHLPLLLNTSYLERMTPGPMLQISAYIPTYTYLRTCLCVCVLVADVGYCYYLTGRSVASHRQTWPQSNGNPLPPRPAPLSPSQTLATFIRLLHSTAARPQVIANIPIPRFSTSECPHPLIAAHLV
ncbi:hypothetical protein F4860DRAFT_25657 [Xylaria cubensis]|nr:hypothetical protein F4860DRAFT_25657 [Xylaria cubensis]